MGKGGSKVRQQFCQPMYLGNDMEEVRGRTIHEAETYLSLPILALPGVVLVPGQTLPLHLFQPSAVAMIRTVVDNDKTFGLVTSRYIGQDYTATHSSIGTTAEILAIKDENDEHVGISTMRVKAIGRQRFEIKETRRQADGIMIAKVLILPECVLPHPLDGAIPASINRVCACENNKTTALPTNGSGDHMAILTQWINSQKRRKVDRLSCANFTWWPPWVYRQYDLHCVMGRVREELQSWNETLKEENMPKDPTDFSFWVAGNLPLDDGLKLHLLRLDNAVQRLRCELSIMQRCTVLCCKDCGLRIAEKKDVFSMAHEGPLGAYVNPGGHVHETLTLYKAQGLSLIGRPSTENSWFPGYAWTILQCQHCHSHMGWKFSAQKSSLKPKKFYGLCRSSLLPGIQNEDKEAETSEEWMPTM